MIFLGMNLPLAEILTIVQILALIILIYYIIHKK